MPVGRRHAADISWISADQLTYRQPGAPPLNCASTPTARSTEARQPPTAHATAVTNSLFAFTADFPGTGAVRDGRPGGRLAPILCLRPQPAATRLLLTADRAQSQPMLLSGLGATLFFPGARWLQAHGNGRRRQAGLPALVGSVPVRHGGSAEVQERSGVRQQILKPHGYA